MPNSEPKAQAPENASASAQPSPPATRSNKRLLVIAAIGVVLIAGTFWVYSRSLLAPESTIRASLLKQTPLGSSKAEVRAVVDKRGWADPDNKGELGGIRFSDSGQKLITTSIGGRLGHYSFPYSTDVFAVWEFDPSNRLIEIQVTKASDQP
jgi:hypothetical protein